MPTACSGQQGFGRLQRRNGLIEGPRKYFVVDFGRHCSANRCAPPSLPSSPHCCSSTCSSRKTASLPPTSLHERLNRMHALGDNFCTKAKKDKKSQLMQSSSVGVAPQTRTKTTGAHIKYKAQQATPTVTFICTPSFPSQTSLAQQTRWQKTVPSSSSMATLNFFAPSLQVVSAYVERRLTLWCPVVSGLGLFGGGWLPAKPRMDLRESERRRTSFRQEK